MLKKSFATAAIVLVPALTLSLNQAAAKEGCGSASWYALTSKTASGERMNPEKLTAAHRTLPFGTKLKVTNQKNGRAVVVRINDRGPFIKGRVIDLSKAAAREIGILQAGHAKICYVNAG
jgi:rare lipoprotein A